MFSVVSGDSLTVIGNKEIDFKDAMAKLIIEQKGLMGIGIGITEYAAEGMGDIGVEIDPRVIKAVIGGGGRLDGC